MSRKGASTAQTLSRKPRAINCGKTSCSKLSGSVPGNWPDQRVAQQIHAGVDDSLSGPLLGEAPQLPGRADGQRAVAGGIRHRATDDHAGDRRVGQLSDGQSSRSAKTRESPFTTSQAAGLSPERRDGIQEAAPGPQWLGFRDASRDDTRPPAGAGNVAPPPPPNGPWKA